MHVASLRGRNPGLAALDARRLARGPFPPDRQSRIGLPVYSVAIRAWRPSMLSVWPEADTTRTGSAAERYPSTQSQSGPGGPRCSAASQRPTPPAPAPQLRATREILLQTSHRDPNAHPKIRRVPGAQRRHDCGENNVICEAAKLRRSRCRFADHS